MLKDYIEVDNDRRDDDDLQFVEEYWSKKLATELTDPVSFEQLQQRDEYSAMEKYLSIFSKGARFVDGGCGRGEWTIFFQKKGFDVIGIDVSSLLIKKLKTRYPDQCFVRGDIRSTGLDGCSMDAMFSWGAFEHFEVGLSPCVLEAFRILKPGGYLFFSIPFANRRIQRRQEQNLVQLQFNFNHSKFQRFYQWRLTRGELARELVMAGFKPLEIIPIHKDVGVRRMIRNDLGIRWRSGSLAETFSTYVLKSIIPKSYVAHMLFAAAQKPLI